MENLYLIFSLTATGYRYRLFTSMKKTADLLNSQYGIRSVKGKWLYGMSFFPTRAFILNPAPCSGILVIDTCGPGSGRIIADAIRDAGMSPADITGIALTHWHRDHTGGLGELISIAQSEGCGKIKVFIHKSDSGFLKNGRGAFLRIHPLLKIPLYHRPGRLPGPEKIELVELDQNSADNPLKQWGVEFLHLPGHTPGNSSFYHSESGSLFSGCGLTLFGKSTAGIVPVFYNRSMQIESAKRLMDLDFNYLYPAHINLRKDPLPREKRIPFTGKIPPVDRITGTLPLFRYGRPE